MSLNGQPQLTLLRLHVLFNILDESSCFDQKIQLPDQIFIVCFPFFNLILVMIYEHHLYCWRMLFNVHVLDISFTCFNVFTNWFIMYLCRSHHAPRDRVTGCGESHRKWGQWLLSPQTLVVLKKVFNTSIMCTGKKRFFCLNFLCLIFGIKQWNFNHREYQYDFLYWYIKQICFKLWI